MEIKFHFEWKYSMTLNANWIQLNSNSTQKKWDTNWNLYPICTNLLLMLPFKLVWKWRLNGSLDWLQPETLKVFQGTHNLEVQFQTFGVPIFISFFRNVEITFHSSVYFTTKISPNFFFKIQEFLIFFWREVISIS